MQAGASLYQGYWLVTFLCYLFYKIKKLSSHFYILHKVQKPILTVIVKEWQQSEINNESPA